MRAITDAADAAKPARESLVSSFCCPMIAPDSLTPQGWDEYNLFAINSAISRLQCDRCRIFWGGYEGVCGLTEQSRRPPATSLGIVVIIGRLLHRTMVRLFHSFGERYAAISRFCDIAMRGPCAESAGIEARRFRALLDNPDEGVLYECRF
ncbi:hypothetical protein D3C80_1197370 [compost metagenome]